MLNEYLKIASLPALSLRLSGSAHSITKSNLRALPAFFFSEWMFSYLPCDLSAASIPLRIKRLTKSSASKKLLLPEPFGPANTEKGVRPSPSSNESMLLKFVIFNERIVFAVIPSPPQSSTISHTRFLHARIVNYGEFAVIKIGVEFWFVGLRDKAANPTHLIPSNSTGLNRYFNNRHRVIAKNIHHFHRNLAPPRHDFLRHAHQFQRAIFLGAERLPFVLEYVVAGPNLLKAPLSRRRERGWGGGCVNLHPNNIALALKIK